MVASDRRLDKEGRDEVFLRMRDIHMAGELYRAASGRPNAPLASGGSDVPSTPCFERVELPCGIPYMAFRPALVATGRLSATSVAVVGSQHLPGIAAGWAGKVLEGSEQLRTRDQGSENL